MPTPGGTTRKFRNAFWPQRRNSYRSRFRWNSMAMFSRQGVGRAEAVDLHRVVDHQIDRHQRVDPLGIAAEPLHRAPHGRQIDHRRHAGEVLEDDAGGLERDLDRRLPDRLPAGQIAHVVLA